MAFNKVKLSQIIRDFIITLDGDDYASNASDSAIRNFALRGIREIGFDLGKKIKSLKREIQPNDSIILPDDFVDLSKIGVVDENGIIRVLGQNKNINHSMHRVGKSPAVEVSDTAVANSFDSEGGPLNILANKISDVESSKSATSTSSSSVDDNLDFYVFENYLYQGGMGRLYGTGGGHLPGDYRVNLSKTELR